MSATLESHDVPRGALLGAGALILATLTLAATVRLSGAQIRPAPVVPRYERDLWFLDRPGGAVGVLDARTAREIAVLAPGTNGFVRATVRTMAQERLTRHIDSSEPFHLAADGSGRIVLADPATGRTIELEAFGATNAAAFARLLTAPAEDDTTSRGGPPP